MRGIVSYLDNKIVQIRGREEKTFEFVNTDLLSPNMIASQTETVFFPKLGKFENQDGTKIIDDWIANNGITSAIPFRQIDSQTGLEVFSGYVKPYGKKTWRGYEHEVISDYVRFVDLAANFNLQSLFPKPESEFTFAELQNMFDDYSLSENELRTKYTNELLDSMLQISPNELKNVCYLDKKFRPTDVLILYISLFFLIAEIVKAVKSITDAGGTVSVTMVATTAVYIAFLVANLVSLLQQIQGALPTLKESKAVQIKLLIEKGCAAIGFPNVTFQEIDYAPEALYVWNAINQPIPNKNLKDFITWFCQVFNMKPRIYNANSSPTGNALIEFRQLKDWWATPATMVNGQVYTIPALQQPELIEENLEDMNTKYSLSFLRDSDARKRDKGEEFGVSFSEIGSFLREPLGGKEQTLDIGYSRAYIKEELTTEEKAYNTLVDVINTVSLGLFGFLFGGGSVNNLKISQDIVGAIQLDDNFLSSPKLVKLQEDECKPTDDNLQVVNANVIYQVFHDYMNPNIYGQWYYVNISGEDRDLKIPVGVDASALIREIIANPVCDFEFMTTAKQVIPMRCVIQQFKRNPEKRLNQFVLAVRPYPQEGGLYSTLKWKKTRSVE